MYDLLQEMFDVIQRHMHDLHRVGRTARRQAGTDGYSDGVAITFFDYAARQPQLAGQFVDLLSSSEQRVPEELRVIAVDVESGGGDGEPRLVQPAWGVFAESDFAKLYV